MRNPLERGRGAVLITPAVDIGLFGAVSWWRPHCPVELIALAVDDGREVGRMRLEPGATAYRMSLCESVRCTLVCLFLDGTGETFVRRDVDPSDLNLPPAEEIW